MSELGWLLIVVAVALLLSRAFADRREWRNTLREVNARTALLEVRARRAESDFLRLVEALEEERERRDA